MYSMPDPIIEGENDPIAQAWNLERSKYIIAGATLGNRPCRVLTKADKDEEEINVYGPASLSACEKFVDVQCAKSVRQYFTKSLAEGLNNATITAATAEPEIREATLADVFGPAIKEPIPYHILKEFFDVISNALTSINSLEEITTESGRAYRKYEIDDINRFTRQEWKRVADNLKAWQEENPSPSPVEEFTTLKSLDAANDYVKTVESVFDRIHNLDVDYSDELFRLDRDDVYRCIASVYEPKPPTFKQSQESLPLTRVFTEQELDELMRSPLWSTAYAALFERANSEMNIGDLRAKFRVALAQFKLDIRKTNNPYMIGEDGFPYISIVSAKNNLGKEVVSVACTDSDIADSYRDYAKHVCGARDFSIRIIPINYLPMKDIMAGLISELNEPDDQSMGE